MVVDDEAACGHAHHTGEPAQWRICDGAQNETFCRIAFCALAPFQTPIPSIRRTSPPSDFIRISSRVIEHIARIRIHLPTSCPERTLYGSLFGREFYFNDGNRAVSALK
jgi:hypothetical protein